MGRQSSALPEVVEWEIGCKCATQAMSPLNPSRLLPCISHDLLVLYVAHYMIQLRVNGPLQILYSLCPCCT